MLFSSQPFIVGFLPIALAGFFALGRLGGVVWAQRWLVAASFFFYGWWNPPYVALLAGSIGANYALGQRILTLARTGRATAAKRWLAAGIGGNLALLAWFKYADFLLQAVTRGQAEHLRVFLPLAVSFFTFQQIMFLVDSLRADRQDAGLLPYACFVAFFPHLIAGPIVRPKDIIPQFTAPDLARPRADNLVEGFTVFLLGLAKKLVLADMFGGFADPGFEAAAGFETLTLVEAWSAALAYALQIYFDFSGYSDMAIGLARMLNVRFPLNFASPYKAVSIVDFWRRWHISLSAFLRDYVYIPLGGNRRGRLRRDANLLITMLLGGMWHGAAWNFVLWGGLHGVFLTVASRWPWRVPAVAGRALTLGAVVIAWVPFRAQGLHASWEMLRAMAGVNGLALPQQLVSLIPPLAWIARPAPALLHLGEGRTLSLPAIGSALALGWAIALAAPAVHEMTPRGKTLRLTAGFAFTAQALFFAPNVAPFLYFQF